MTAFAWIPRAVLLSLLLLVLPASLPMRLVAASRSAGTFSLDGPGLSPAERFVREQVGAGKPADVRARFGDGTNTLLRGAFIEALLALSGTNVHRNGVTIENATVREAIELRNATVDHEVSLLNCRFEGPVNLEKSVFANTISLARSTFLAPVSFSAMKVGRIAALDHATFAERVNAAQLEVSGALSARATHFNSPTGAVDFTSLKVSGDAFFTKATFAGPVTFQFARIADNWRCEGCAFTNPAALVSFEAVQVGATTSFEESSFAGYVSFKDARFTTLGLGQIQWPSTHRDHPWLWLNGMTFQRISAGSEKESWKHLFDLVQNTARDTAYSATVYAGLEDYYRRLGYPNQADMFFRAQKQREREEVLSGFPLAWSFFLDWFVGYGRSPQRAFLWSVAIIAFGCLVFRPDRMEPQKEEYRTRKYSPFWYSMDVYLPVIKLHDAEIWKPKEECPLALVWRRIHTVLGWALIPIAIAAWTGMLAH